MIGYEIETTDPAALARFVRALGQHRYVASRLHLVHAFAVDAAAAGGDSALADAADWAKRVLGAGVIDLGSRDERLYRKTPDAELAAVLDAFWSPGEKRDAVREALRSHLAKIDVEIDLEAPPFDEAREDDVFPVLVDAGWELLPLKDLDPERHRGAIRAFDDFEVARFEEESAIPPLVTLHELPVLGAVELLAPEDEDGALREPFVLWTQGHETYVDYVLRGVLRAAKIEPKE